eukprot:Phypoly_transcript_07312.p1 GENE.Phypoly_transcript_07312~~Phypoly_transcript_07312.p1  ORF type:complete len:514 (+),score=45.80 Phypoly_transcript_07312:13-1554(+)
MKTEDPYNAQVSSDMRTRVRRWYYLVICSSFFWLFWVLLFVFYSIAFVGTLSGTARFSFFGTLVWFAMMCVCYFGLIANHASLAPFSSYATRTFSVLDRLTNATLHFLASVMTVLAIQSIFGRVTTHILFISCNSGWFCLSAPLFVTIAYGVVFGALHVIPPKIRYNILEKRLFTRLRSILLQTIVSPSGVPISIALLVVIVTINIRAWIWHYDAASRISFKASIALVLGSLCANFFTKLVYRLVNVFWAKPVSFDSPHAARQRNIHLIAALCDETCIANLHAFLDLYLLSRQSPIRRSALYLDDNGAGWVAVINTVIRHVDQLTVAVRQATTDISRVKTPAPTPAISPKVHPLKQKIDNYIETFLQYFNEPPETAFSNHANIFDETKLLYSNAQLLSWAIPALCNLLIHSKEEDKYGVAVQHQSLPSVLCAFVDCLSANEEFLKAASSIVFGGNVDNLRAGFGNSMYSPFVAVDLMTNAIYSLVTNFYASISFYKYPPKVTERLKLFVDFKE